MAHDRSSPSALTSGRRLARNVAWNLLGQGLPLLVGLATIPLLIDGLGIERFGILALAWMVVGYFSLFDLGLGRALTKMVAEKLGDGQDDDIPALVWTALALMGVLGIGGALLAAGLTPLLVRAVLKIPTALQAETINAFYLIALSIPVVTSSAGLSGVLQAYQRFAMLNSARIPLSLWSFLGPLAVLPFSNNMVPVVAMLVAGRVVGWGVYLWLCLRTVPNFHYDLKIRREMVRRLVRFGSWMTVSNVIGPLMVYLDRFLISALLSLTAVAYYVTPYVVVTKLWIIPGALLGVLFPAFSTILTQDRGRAARLFSRAVNYIFLSLFPLVLIIVALAHEGLEFWLGEEFARNSAAVLRWLAVGVFINSLAHVPSALIQSAGRPDLRAKTHLIELPFYLLALWWLLGAYGIEGAAIAWVVRIALDAVVFFIIARWVLPETGHMIRHFAFIVAGALGAFGVAIVPVGLLMKGLFLFAVMCVFGLLSWLLLLAPEERRLVKRLLGQRVV